MTRRRVAAAVLWGLAAFHVVDTVRLHRRRCRLVALPAPPADRGDRGDRGHRLDRSDLDGRDAQPAVASIAGADVQPGILAAAAAEMRASGVEVVDLVPGDLPAERALALLRRVDQQRVRDDPLHAPGGAHEVVVLGRGLAGRMGMRSQARQDRREMVRTTVDAQRHAGGAAVLRVASGLRATGLPPRDRWAEAEELTAALRPFANLAPAVLGFETAWLLLLTGGLVVAPGPALAALVTWSAQPAVVLGARPPVGPRPPLHPPGLGAASLLRLPRAWVDNLRTIAAGIREGRAARARRAALPPMPSPPAEDLFEPRRRTCPWCGSASLEGRVDVPDFFQHKPGLFHLDECRDCGHVFQNPRLSSKGLDHHYDHFYDGLAGEAADVGFAQATDEHHKRIAAIARFTEPRTWLDVGTGHGHFCVTARRRWPGATVDGLDISDSVEAAERRGWVDRGYRGQFPDLAGELPRYDVVSMSHYLEHTRDPRRELAAAARVLLPGGHLVIDVPDPEAPLARWLGRYWVPWFQPQHQHLVPCRNLVTALDEAGFEVLSVERGPASTPSELTGVVLFAVQRLSRSPHMPWLPVPSAAQRACRCAVVLGSVPFFLVALAIEKIRDARLTPEDVGNAYRVVARRR